MSKVNLSLLVIGGTGFIGRYVVREAIKRGFAVSVFSLNIPKTHERLVQAKYFSLDIRDISSLKKVTKNENFDYVINLGGYINHSKFNEGGRQIIDDHFSSVLNIIECVNWHGLKGFLQVGSSSEYGDNKSPQNENMIDKPFSPYSLAKSAATQTLKMLHHREDFPSIIVRIYLAYGPGQSDDRFIPQIIKGCFADEEFKTSEGLNYCDFTYVEDISAGIMDLLVCNAALGEVVNLASGKPVQIKSIVEKINKIINKGKPVFGSLDNPINNENLYADISKAKSLIDWETSIELDEGLSKTIASYATNFKLKERS